MKKLSFAILFVSMCFSISAVEKQKLPAIDTLKDLPLKQVANFMDHEELASSALPVISTSGDLFFYDSKHKQLFKSNVENHKLTPISKFGEGPKEYAGVTGLIIEGKHLFVSEGKGKIIRFDLNGVFQEEWRTKGHLLTKMIAKDGDSFYMEGMQMTSKGLGLALYLVQKGHEAKQIMALLSKSARADAVGRDGKVIKGGGIFPLDSPVYYVTNNRIYSSASEDYEFNIHDKSAKKIQTVYAEFPDAKSALKNYKKYSTTAYSITDIFVSNKHIIVITNFLKNDKPRIDFFDFNGTYKKSFILPFKTWFHLYPAVSVSGHYLIHTDRDEVGFTVYEIL